MKYIKTFGEFINEALDLNTYIAKEKIPNNILEFSESVISDWFKNAGTNIPVDISKKKDNLVLWFARNIKKVILDNTIKYGHIKDAVMRGEDAEIDFEYMSDIMNNSFNNMRDYIMSNNRNENVYKINFMSSFNQMIEVSEKWHNELKASGLVKSEKGTVLKEYSDGYYWIDLGTNDCKEEADAMGHCGMTGADTLVSLRKRKMKGIESFVTMAIDKEDEEEDGYVEYGTIYQIKGKNNKKPNSEYHKYIVDFMCDYMVFGYSPEYNSDDDFQLKDLTLELFGKVVSSVSSASFGYGNELYETLNCWVLSPEQIEYLVVNYELDVDDIKIADALPLMGHTDFFKFDNIIYDKDSENTCLNTGSDDISIFLEFVSMDNMPKKYFKSVPKSLSKDDVYAAMVEFDPNIKQLIVSSSKETIKLLDDNIEKLCIYDNISNLWEIYQYMKNEYKFEFKNIIRDISQYYLYKTFVELFKDELRRSRYIIGGVNDPKKDNDGNILLALNTLIYDACLDEGNVYMRELDVDSFDKLVAYIEKHGNRYSIYDKFDIVGNLSDYYNIYDVDYDNYGYEKISEFIQKIKK